MIVLYQETIEPLLSLQQRQPAQIFVVRKSELPERHGSRYNAHIQLREEDKVAPKRSRVALVVILATIVCVAGVLILPQVDLPDFMINGSKSFTTAVAHAKLASSASVFDLPGSLNSLVRSRRFCLFGSLTGFTDVNLSLNTRCPLRC